MCPSGRARQTEEKEKVKTERPVATAGAGAADGADGAAVWHTTHKILHVRERI